MVGRRRVGHAKQVQRRPQPFGRQLALRLGARQQIVDAQPGHALGLRAKGDAARGAEDGQPKRALPCLGGREQEIVLQRGARLPRLHHLGSRRRVFLEEWTQPEGELAAPTVNSVARPTAREKIVAHRRHLRPLEKAVVVKQRQQVAFDLLRIHHAAVGDRLLGHMGQQLAQKRDLQVGSNSTRPRHAQAQIGLHVAVGHHHAHRCKGTFALPFALLVAHERRQAAPRCGWSSKRESCGDRITRGRKSVCGSEQAPHRLGGAQMSEKDRLRVFPYCAYDQRLYEDGLGATRGGCNVNAVGKWSQEDP